MDYTVKLNPQDMAVIFQGLGELPLKISHGTFAKLQQTAMAQEAAARQEAAAAAAPAKREKPAVPPAAV